MPQGDCARANNCADISSMLVSVAVCNDVRCVHTERCVEGTPASLGVAGTVCSRGLQSRCPAGSLCDANGNCVITATTAMPTPAPTGPVCGNGMIESGEQCDGQPLPGCCEPLTCRLRPRSFVCRPAAGTCDVPEVCSGTAASCPADALYGSNVICRQSGGECDLPETCTGASAACPQDRVLIQNVCRPAVSVCDVADACSGQRTCGPNLVYSSTAGRVCRPSAGQCDVEEVCSGADVCGPNAFKPIGSPCDDGNSCTSPDTCGANGVCGGPNSCTCRSDADCDDKNVCTIDKCDGTAAAPGACKYAPAAAGTVCRPAQSLCDVAEVCSGASTQCPVDGVAPSSVVCRQANGTCDVAESCSGVSPACPMDGFLPATTKCRPAVAGCDADELCTGNSGECPPDAVLDGGAMCRSAKSECDVAETCNGKSAQCPIDLFAANGVTCRAKQPACDGGSMCVAGVCSTKSSCACARDADCDDSNPCTDDKCVAMRCSYQQRDPGAACDDGNLCTVQDVCTAESFCVGSSSTCMNACSLHGECCAGECRCDVSRRGQFCELFANGSLADAAMTAAIGASGTRVGDPSANEVEAPSDGADVGAIVGGVIGALIALLLLVVLIVFGLRMWNNRQAEAKTRKAIAARFDLETPLAPDGTAMQDMGDSASVARSIPRTHQYHSSPASAEHKSTQFVAYGAMPRFKDEASSHTESGHYKVMDIPSDADGYEDLPVRDEGYGVMPGAVAPPRPLVFVSNAFDGDLTAAVPDTVESDPTVSLRPIGDSSQYRTIQFGPKTVVVPDDLDEYNPTPAEERPLPYSSGYMRRPMPPAQRPANWVPRKFVAAKAAAPAASPTPPPRKPMPPVPVARP